MSELTIKDPREVSIRNRRVGRALLLLALFYIAAVIAFIIVY